MPAARAGWVHFGLGTTAKAEVRVIWPDGTSGDWQPVEAGGFYIVEARQAAASPKCQSADGAAQARNAGRGSRRHP